MLAQTTEAEYIATEATIDAVDFTIKSRRSAATAKVSYVTQAGDSLSSTVKLPHVPFIGTWYDQGDTITVLYNKNTPLVLKTKGSLFTESYGLYLLIGFGVLYMFFRFRRSRK